jgi:hypothetical protein
MRVTLDIVILSESYCRLLGQILHAKLAEMRPSDDGNCSLTGYKTGQDITFGNSNSNIYPRQWCHLVLIGSSSESRRASKNGTVIYGEALLCTIQLLTKGSEM